MRVFILAEDGIARAGLASLLAREPGISVVGQSTPEAVLTVGDANLEADVIIWDLGWEAGIGLDRLEDVAESVPPILVLVPDGEASVEAWAAGARGVILRNAPTEVIGAAVRGVGLGLTVAGDGLQPGADHGTRPPAEVLPERLTAREQEVLQLIAQGLANKGIAARLGVTQATVKFHVNSLMRKLGAQSRTEAVVRASRMGLILL